MAPRPARPRLRRADLGKEGRAPGDRACQSTPTDAGTTLGATPGKTEVTAGGSRVDRELSPADPRLVVDANAAAPPAAPPSASHATGRHQASRRRSRLRSNRCRRDCGKAGRQGGVGKARQRRGGKAGRQGRGEGTIDAQEACLHRPSRTRRGGKPINVARPPSRYIQTTPASGHAAVDVVSARTTSDVRAGYAAARVSS
jgi:hypothetical protein